MFTFLLTILFVSYSCCKCFAFQNVRVLTLSFSQLRATLYDVPVSNNGARVRMIIRAKELDKKEGFKIVPPSDIGGLRSEAYLNLNPQGKMPVLVTDRNFVIPESDVICRYLLERYKNVGPTFEPQDLDLRCLSNQICRFIFLRISVYFCIFHSSCSSTIFLFVTN